MTDERDDQADQFDEDEDIDSDAGSGDDAAPPADPNDSKDSGNSDKRINDLMGKWQSEQAKNRQLEARIAALEGGDRNDGEEKGKRKVAQKPAADPRIDEFLALAQTQARQTLFNSDPRFAEYGFEVDAIEGTDAKSMQASRDRLAALVDKVEGSARTRALQEHGLDPDIAGGAGDKPLDFTTMSDKEILELGDRVIGRG